MSPHAPRAHPMPAHSADAERLSEPNNPTPVLVLVHVLVLDPESEPPWVCRRPQFSRDWGHERGKEVLPRDPGAGGSAGAGPRGGIPVAVGGDRVDCGEDRLLE